MNKTIIAGVDDATKCPCIGSIFIAGVVADTKTISYWHSIGVKDSKLVSAKKREYLASIIKASAVSFAINQITASQIDNKIINLNDWEMLMVLNVVSRLVARANPGEIIIDNWETKEEIFYRRLKEVTHPSFASLRKTLGVKIKPRIIKKQNFRPEHKADTNHTVVGAASILAKVASDNQYKKFRKIFGDFGSGSPGDPKTRKFVWQHRKSPLPIIRTSWQTYKHLSNLKTIEEDFLFAKSLNK